MTERNRPGDLAARTRKFALDVLKFAGDLPETPASSEIRYQLLKCGTSVGANYRAAKRARSRNEFVAKLGIVEEEADECLFWLELLDEAKMIVSAGVAPLHGECSEILAMVVASIRTARGRNGD